MDPHSFTLILQSDVAGTTPTPCVGYGQIPLMVPTRLLLIGDARASTDVDRLRDVLEQEFAALSPGGTLPCGGPGGTRCWATSEPATRNVLLVIANDHPPSGPLEIFVQDWLNRGFEVLGFFKSGLKPDVVLPAALHAQLAVTWQYDVREVAGEIVDIAVMGLEDRRIFISYARADGSSTAEHLADILTGLRFDVFLDRFRIPPGADLMERISDELVDKAMVVVVETPEAVKSQWVRHEVSTAITRRLGLAAVNLVGVAPLPGIDEAVRCRDNKDDVLAQFLLEQHRNQMSNKRQNLMQSVWHSLSREAGRTSVHALPDGFYVTRPSIEYAVAVQTRPADLHRFRITHEKAGTATPVVIHSQPQRADRRRDLSWLSQHSGVAEVDEGLIDRAARKIGKGLL
jgi:hypothetical protein